jgi:hypothetical protein
LSSGTPGVGAGSSARADGGAGVAVAGGAVAGDGPTSSERASHPELATAITSAVPTITARAWRRMVRTPVMIISYFAVNAGLLATS